MDISFAKDQFKIKGKTGSVLVGKDLTIEGEKPFVINGAGEFEVGGISVIGLGEGAYVVELDNFRICKLTQKLTDKQLEDMGSIDIALMTSLDPEIVKQTDPWVAITTNKIEGVEGVGKYSVGSRDKLPGELVTVWLTS